MKVSPNGDDFSVGATFGRRYRTFLSLIKIVLDKFNMCVNTEFT